MAKQFTNRSMQRISDVVRTVEKAKIDLTPPTRRHKQIPRRMRFPGIAYIAGKKIPEDGSGDPLLNSDGTKPYVKCDRSTRTATEELGPAPDPMPPNEEWYKKDETPGAIHVTSL